MRRPALQQQLLEPITGRYDCGAYSAAMAADAHSSGKWVFTGRQVRLATDEKKPDPISPGLNLRQTDDALVLLTKGEVNLDTQWDRDAAPWGRVEAFVKAGKWAHLCVWRGQLVDAGFSGGDRFRGNHGVLIGYDPEDKTPIMADPLVPYWQDVTWAALKRAAGGFASIGFAAVAFTKIPAAPPPTVRYSVKFTAQSFFAYRVNAWTLKIIDREPRKYTKPTSAPSTGPARAYNWPGHGNRKLVQIRDGGLEGLYVEPGASGLRLVVAK